MTILTNIVFSTTLFATTAQLFQSLLASSFLVTGRIHVQHFNVAKVGSLSTQQIPFQSPIKTRRAIFTSNGCIKSNDPKRTILNGDIMVADSFWDPRSNFPVR